MLAPCNVTLLDPVPAVFTRLATLKMARPADMPDDALPTSAPTVMTAFKLPLVPLPAWHRTLVSDSHVLLSHVVPPRLTARDRDAVPSPLPNTVKLIDPENITFRRSNKLAPPRFVDRNAVTLPVNLRTETTASLLPAPPDFIRHRAEVSDAQDVRSQLDPPTLAPTHGPDRLMPPPLRVKLLDPLEMMF